MEVWTLPDLSLDASELRTLPELDPSPRELRTLPESGPGPSELRTLSNPQLSNLMAFVRTFIAFAPHHINILIALFSYRSFATILDSCLGRSSTDRLKISDQLLYLPFRADQPIEYEPIQWQTDPRFVVQAPSPSRVLQPRNEPNTDQQINNNTNIILLDDNDDQNYVDANGDEENEPPKLKKKGKKKKQQAKLIETNNDTSIQLNTSSNRASTTGQKLQVNIFFFSIIVLFKYFS
jgi:hypothetical protein